MPSTGIALSCCIHFHHLPKEIRNTALSKKEAACKRHNIIRSVLRTAVQLFALHLLGQPEPACC